MAYSNPLNRPGLVFKAAVNSVVPDQKSLFQIIPVPLISDTVGILSQET